MSVSPLFVTTFDDGRGSLVAIHGVGAHGLRFVFPEAGRYVSVDLVNGLRRQLEEQLDYVRIDVPHTIPADTPELLAKLVTDFVDRHQLTSA